MTDIEVDAETLARRIADRGEDALLARLRTAYADAAAAHADLISLDDDQIEAMVQATAENADGLQWRRALADVAAEELGISATQALTHPAVARAQALVGAPSYEQSLAELLARPVPPPAPRAVSTADPAANGSSDTTATAATEPEPPAPEPPAPEPEPEPEPEPPMPGPSVAAQQPAAAEESETHRSVSAADAELPPTVEHQSLDPSGPAHDELEAVEADDVVVELLPEPDPIEYETEAYDIEGTFAQEEPLATAPYPASVQEPQPYAEAAEEPQQYEPADQEPQPYAEAVEEPYAAAVDEPAPYAPDSGEPELTIPAIHQGGVANLPTKREGLNVRLSAEGLDILQGEHDIIGRLIWDEIETLEVPQHRSLRRRHETRARLVVRTPHGDASFDVPGISSEDLRDRVEPIVSLYGRH